MDVDGDSIGELSHNAILYTFAENFVGVVAQFPEAVLQSLDGFPMDSPAAFPEEALRATQVPMSRFKSDFFILWLF